MGERSARLVLLRHGESLWNQEGRFTGWMDIDLSEKGRLEARDAGRLMQNSEFIFDMAYTSVLKRAIRTLWIVLEEMDLMWIPTYPSWRLNERFYGDLQGRKKLEMEEIYGIEQVHRWRRGFREHPPAMPVGDERFPGNDPRYRHLEVGQIPRSESLQDTQERTPASLARSNCPRAEKRQGRTGGLARQYHPRPGQAYREHLGCRISNWWKCPRRFRWSMSWTTACVRGLAAILRLDADEIEGIWESWG